MSLNVAILAVEVTVEDVQCILDLGRVLGSVHMEEEPIELEKSI